MAEFVYAGQFMGGTVITENGETQDTWNADTKLDKITNKMSNISSSYEYIYVSSKNRNLAPRRMDDRIMSGSGEAPYQIVCRDRSGNGQIRVPETPTETYHATSKQYVDNAFKVYQHNMYFYIEYYGDTANIRFTLYDGGANAKGYAKTNGTMAVSGYATISSRTYPMLYADIDTINSFISITYLTDNGEETTTMDAGEWTINDTVTRII